MKYNNDILTPEEEEYLYRLPDPRRQIGETPTPYEMNPQLAMYLRGGRASGNPTISQINAGAMQGIAGGLAQLGTVHGQTPDVSPFTKALAATAQQPTKSDIDPRVVAYLQGGKQPQWRVVGKTQDGKIIYSDGQKEWLGENQSYVKPERQAATPKKPDPKPPKPAGSDLPIDKRKQVEKLASDAAGYKSSKAQLDAGIVEYQKALRQYQQTGRKDDADLVVRAGQSMLKILNSPIGSDAVGAEEVARLGNALQFQFVNIHNPGKFWGYDFAGFNKQIKSASDKIGNTAQTLQNEIDSMMGRTPSQTQIQPKRIRVKKGNDMLDILPEDLPAATAAGYIEVK